MSTDGQRTKWRRNIAENLNRLSRVHERYRQTTDGRTTYYISSLKTENDWRDRQSLSGDASLVDTFPSLFSTDSRYDVNV